MILINLERWSFHLSLIILEIIWRISEQTLIGPID